MSKQNAVESIQKNDIEIISLLNAGEFKGWEFLYNKYAPIMYGTIMPAVNFDKAVANEMMIKCFSELKSKAFFTVKLPASLGLYLVQHCCSVLKTNAHKFKKDTTIGASEGAYPILQAFIKDKQPLKTIAAKLGVTEGVAMMQLRAELKHSRNNTGVSV